MKGALKGYATRGWHAGQRVGLFGGRGAQLAGCPWFLVDPFSSGPAWPPGHHQVMGLGVSGKGGTKGAATREPHGDARE